MSLTIVNGYPCRDCAEIAKAKRGENPNASSAEAAGPSGNADKPGDVNPSKGHDAVSFGGSLADLRGDAAPRPAPTSPPIGRAVDLLA